MSEREQLKLGKLRKSQGTEKEIWGFPKVSASPQSTEYVLKFHQKIVKDKNSNSALRVERAIPELPRTPREAAMKTTLQVIQV